MSPKPLLYVQMLNVDAHYMQQYKEKNDFFFGTVYTFQSRENVKIHNTILISHNK